MNKSYFGLIGIILISLAGCTTAPTPPPAEEINLQGVALYYSRASMGRTDFEQYRLSGNTLYRECGRIVSGRHNPQEQEVLSVADADLASIKDDAWQLRRFVREKNVEFQKSGDNSSFFDPGQLTLALEFPDDTVNISTSFDSVANPNAPREKRTNELALALRKTAHNPPCGRADFYGLGAKRLPN